VSLSARQEDGNERDDDERLQQCREDECNDGRADWLRKVGEVDAVAFALGVGLLADRYPTISSTR
jgi:hypothetical protein